MREGELNARCRGWVVVVVGEEVGVQEGDEEGEDCHDERSLMKMHNHCAIFVPDGTYG